MINRQKSYMELDMRKCSAIVLSVLIMFLTMGCTILHRSGFNQSQLNTIAEAMLSEVTQDGNMLSYSLINNTDETIWYGSDIKLEKERFGKWYRIDPLAEFTAEIYNLPSGREEIYKINLDYWKDIESGKYRIIKTFMLTEYNEVRKVEEPGKEYYYVSREFEIKN
jgi:hypothetical protein